MTHILRSNYSQKKFIKRGERITKVTKLFLKPTVGIETKGNTLHR